MSRSWHGGKGDRPRSMNRKKWNEGYDRVFGKKRTKYSKRIVKDKNNGG